MEKIGSTEECHNSIAYSGLQLGTGSAEIAAARCGDSRRAGAVAACRGPRPEIIRARKLLSEPNGPDDFPVSFHQTAVGLIPEQRTASTAMNPAC